MMKTKGITMALLLWTMVQRAKSTDNCDINLDNFAPAILTCENRCGKTYAQLPCACDPYCPIYDDCCDDFAFFCGSDVIESDDDSGDMDSRNGNSTDPPGELENPNRTSTDHPNGLDTPNVNSSDDSGRLEHSTVTSPDHSKGLERPFVTSASYPNRSDDLNGSSSDLPGRLEYIHATSTDHPGLPGHPDSNTTGHETGEHSQVSSTDPTAPTAHPREASADLVTLPERVNVDSLPIDRSGAMHNMKCLHRTRLISRCPRPAKPLPVSPVQYGAVRILPEEVVARCDISQTPEAAHGDINQAFPVTDAASGLHFANIFCLLCHGGQADDARVWSLGFLWNVKKLRESFDPQNFSAVLDIARDLEAPSVAISPSGYKARRCFPGGLLHDFACRCPSLDQLCRTMADGYVYLNGKHFRNIHCAKCYFVQEMYARPDYVLYYPNMEETLINKNVFDFPMTMRIVSEPDGGGPMSLDMSVPETSKYSFAWTRMTCAISASSHENPESDQHVVKDDEDEGDVKKGVKGGKRTWTRNSLPNDKEQQQKPTKTTKNTVIPNWSAPKAGVDEEFLPQGSGCSQRTCTESIPYLDGICDWQRRVVLINLQLHSLPPEPLVGVTPQQSQQLQTSMSFADDSSEGSSTQDVQLPSHMAADLALSLRRNLSSTAVGTDVGEVLGTRRSDGSYYNVTVNFLVTTDITLTAIEREWEMARYAYQHAPAVLLGDSALLVRACVKARQPLLFITRVYTPWRMYPCLISATGSSLPVELSTVGGTVLDPSDPEQRAAADLQGYLESSGVVRGGGAAHSHAVLPSGVFLVVVVDVVVVVVRI